MHAILDDCLLILRNQYKNRIEIRKQYTKVPYKFKGNEGKLHQAFLNILANADQAIKDKGVITIHTDIRNNVFQITISDTGQGIANDIIKQIFDPFFTTKDPGKGTGLGLSIAYDIIQEHNGLIKFESTVGEGTKVVIFLPL